LVGGRWGWKRERETDRQTDKEAETERLNAKQQKGVRKDDSYLKFRKDHNNPNF
jgi:hypothetical protein